MEIVIMNFSRVYETQDFYRAPEGEVRNIDCRDIQGTNCYCDQEAERGINARMGELGPRGIHFLDSGNYHYLSKIWLDRVGEPFELLVFDHHTDMQTPMFGDILSCGGWIKAALEHNPYLKHVWLAGPPRQAAEEAGLEAEAGLTGTCSAQNRSNTRAARITWFDEAAITDVSRRPALFQPRHSASTDLPLYISVDKDILRPEDARTNWDQGTLSLDILLACIKAAASCRSIIGMDICGENPEGMDGPDAETERRINNRTNGLLAGCLTEGGSK